MGKVNVETERLCPREVLVRKKIPKKSFLKNSTAKNKTSDTCETFSSKFFDEFISLQEQNERKISQLRRIKQIRGIVKDSDKTIVLLSDCSENAKLFQTLQKRLDFYKNI